MGTANVNEEDGRPQLCNRAFIAAGVLARSLLVVPKYVRFHQFEWFVT